jgi:hypothetical protein
MYLKCIPASGTIGIGSTLISSHGHDKSKTNYEHPDLGAKKFNYGLWIMTRTKFKDTLHLTTRPSHKFEFSG